MARAIELAWRGIGRNSPNPLVGCVIVRDDETVAEGSHYYPDIEHAEIVALKKAREKAKGATLYVSIEPCCHTGRTPPCCHSIIKAGISKVVYGVNDPDPRVNGGGHRALADGGIEVTGGVLENECRELNKFFLTAKDKNRPFILLKWAMTLDGKIATRIGKSQWISGERSRNATHHLRNIYDAVLAGHTTVIIDNPSLTCRADQAVPLPEELFPAVPGDIRDPVRIVIDTFGATIAHQCGIYDQPGKTIVAIGPEPAGDDSNFRDSIDKEKIELLECPLTAGHIDLGFLMHELVERDIQSVLVEGGSGVHAAFLDNGLADEILCVVGPKIFGGDTAPSPVSGAGIEEVTNAVQLSEPKHLRIDNDLMIHGKVKFPSKD